VFSAYGEDNVYSYSPRQDEVADSKGLSVTYHNVNGNTVTVSGYKNGGRTIVYRRDVVGQRAIDTLYWSYPAAQKAKWDAAVTRTVHAFKAGDLANDQPKPAFSYNIYYNPRYGFTTLWPSSLRSRQPFSDESGQEWVSPDGGVVLSAYGSNNFDNYSPQQDEMAISRDLSVTYQDIRGNVVIVSGYKNGGRTIVYRRDVVGQRAIDTLYWSYPVAQKAKWNAAVTRTAHAFKAGDVATQH
jgi:hypothetical protein